jgi:hypothetical protein
MIKSVIREHHYPPQVIDLLFLDEQDHEGIIWLYNDINEQQAELEKKYGKK